MKIISKYKDYYDYLVGIYGSDTKLILDRTKAEKIDISRYNNGTILKLILANKEYHGIYYNHKVYWPNEVDQLFTICTSKSAGWRLPKHHNDADCIIINLNDKFNLTPSANNYISLINGRTVDCNDICTMTISYVKYSYRSRFSYILGHNDNNIIHYPILSDINFYTRLSPEECWIEISNFLSNKISSMELQSTPIDNDIKIQSAGFDLKTSFRPKIKK